MKKLAIAFLLSLGLSIGAQNDYSSVIIDALKEHGFTDPWDMYGATDSQIIKVMRTLFESELRKKLDAERKKEDAEFEEEFEEVLQRMIYLRDNPTPKNVEVLSALRKMVEEFIQQYPGSLDLDDEIDDQQHGKLDATIGKLQKEVL